MPETEEWVIVDCRKGELPRIGEHVHIEHQGGEVHLVGETCRLRAISMIDENQADIDMTYINGTVGGFEELRPTLGSYPDHMTEQQVIEATGKRHAVCIYLPAAEGRQTATPG